MLRRFISAVSKYLKILIYVAAPFFILWAILQGYSFTWAGFVGKTLWDWMDLLIIPIVLGFGAIFLNRSERESDRQRADERAKVEREIATDRQRENALQTYIDRMADLLLNEKLRTTKNKEVRDVARTRTLSVLRGLDGSRKTILFQFLVEAKLIGIEKPIIELQGVDLSGAILAEAKLSGADMSQANMRHTNLLYAYLNHTNLAGADLSGAILWRTDLRSADLKRAYMEGAELHNAKLSGANMSGAVLRDADLSGVDLKDADLTGASLGGADLSDANLSNVKVTNKQLEEAKSLKNATMPDGTKHD